MLVERGRDGTRVENRKAPIVETDALGEQLGEALEQGKASYRDVKGRPQSIVNDVRSESA